MRQARPTKATVLENLGVRAGIEACGRIFAF
jgi:hypothetical protein